MAGPALQLFPPPPRPPRQTSPNRSPNRSPNGRRNRSRSGSRSGSPNVRHASQFHAPTSEPIAERMESATSAKPPRDFHELVIQVNSVPVSPAQAIPPPSPVAHIPRIHIPNSQHTTIPQQIYTSFEPPSQSRSFSPHLANQTHFHQAQDFRTQSPAFSVQHDHRTPQSRALSPDPIRAISPAFSDAATLVRPNSSAARTREMSPEEDIPMRSMFPVFNPAVPLANQAYQPSQTSPTQLPRTQISRSPYAPNFYVPHNNVQANGKPNPKTPFFTPANLLDNLWLATNGQEEPSVQIYTLKMHRATAANPTVTFGTTPSLPFYSLGQSNLADGYEIPSIMNELLIQRHHPTQPRVLPVAHMDLIAPPSLDAMGFDPTQQEPTALLTSIYPKLAALQALDAAANSPAASRLALCDPGAQSPEAQRLAEEVLAGTAQRECCALAWIKDSPQPQGNPWAQHMPSEGSYQLHHPVLGTFPIALEGDCSVINAPSTRPVTAFYGQSGPTAAQINGNKPASITILNPYVLSPTTPRTNAFSPLPPPPPRIDSLNRPTSMTPSEMSFSQLPTSTDATADDVVLARLDLANDALILNVGVLTRFGNPFLVDVATSTLLAVAVAEATRGRRKQYKNQDNFEPPPPSFSVTHQKDDTAKAFKESFVEGFQSFGGKTNGPINGSSFKKFTSSLKGSSASRSTSTSASFDKDIELGDWYGQENKTKKSKANKKKQRKEKEDEEKLPLVTRIIISILSFAFKSAVFILKIAIKIIAGVIVMITRNFSKL